jgi:UDP-N-acetylmuramoyl-L-alanyl-D-glutamate--2,6-diaminopimelate ligase
MSPLIPRGSSRLAGPRDHLDVHITMDNYFAAKRRLFIDGRSAHTVINLDDGYGARLAREPELDRP